MAAMQSDPLHDTTYVTGFMEGLRISVARTEVFRYHLSTSKEAVSISQNAKHNFTSARLKEEEKSFARATSANTLTYCKPEPIVFSIDVEKVKLSFRLQSNTRK